MNQLKKAIEIAKSAHEGQVDRAGKAYFGHVSFVANRVSHLGDDYAIVGYLHDVVEDSGWSGKDLIDAGISPDLVHSVELLSKNYPDSNVSADEYLKRVKDNEIARKVKIADLLHNMDVSRLDEIKKADLSRGRKYANQVAYLAL